MEIAYEVDLRERKTARQVECIYSGNDYDEALSIAEEHNKTLPDYDVDLGCGDYYDGKSDGLYAEVWICEHESDINGVGKYNW